MSATVSLGGRLKQIREERGLNKTQMADLLKIGRVAYGNYENGVRHPECTIIPEFCEALGVTADYLLGMSETRTPAYAKVAETTGLNEEAILYLKRIRQSSLRGNVDIINMLLNDEPDTSHFDFVSTTPPPPMSDAEMERQYAEYTAWVNGENKKPILEALSEEWGHNDYLSGMSDEEIIAQGMKEREEMEEYYASIPPLTEEESRQALIDLKRQQDFFEREWKKSNLLSRISDYLAYHDGCSLYSFGQEEALSSEHQICLGIGKKYMSFPSKESNELFEFMLIQKIIDALKVFKKNFQRNQEEQWTV